MLVKNFGAPAYDGSYLFRKDYELKGKLGEFQTGKYRLFCALVAIAFVVSVLGAIGFSSWGRREIFQQSTTALYATFISGLCIGFSLMVWRFSKSRGRSNEVKAAEAAFSEYQKALGNNLIARPRLLELFHRSEEAARTVRDNVRLSMNLFYINERPTVTVEEKRVVIDALFDRSRQIPNYRPIYPQKIKANHSSIMKSFKEALDAYYLLSSNERSAGVCFGLLSIVDFLRFPSGKSYDALLSGIEGLGYEAKDNSKNMKQDLVTKVNDNIGEGSLSQQTYSQICEALSPLISRSLEITRDYLEQPNVDAVELNTIKLSVQALLHCVIVTSFHEEPFIAA